LATRGDVAELAGVSGATVSYVVNSSKKVSEKVQKRVFDAIEKLDYHPNLIGRSLVSKKTKHVAILVDSLKNPHYCEILEGAQQVAFQNNYLASILLSSVSNMRIMTDLVARGVDGAILTQLESHLIAYIKTKIPCVSPDNHIIVDYKDAIFNMVECLKEKGHRKIAFLSGLPVIENNDRYIHFCDAMNYFKLELDPRLVYTGTGDRRTDEQAGAEGMKALLSKKRPFTAVFALNDLMCIGAASVLRDAGIKIPRDISITGCDNLEILKWFTPSLSSINVFPYKIGVALMNYLIQTLEGIKPEEQVIKCEFLKKESITRVRNRLVLV
jgi:DNA-binding LacI/PurR family transcriptional regulator